MSGEDRTGGDGGRGPLVVRILCHGAVWAAVLLPTFSEIARGWRAFGDDAAIASRAYQVFSLHPPLLGLSSSVSTGTGHNVFDPGPLMFFLLSVPVHLDPPRGLLWGAALLSGAAFSVAVEAAWSTARWVGAIVVAFVVLDMAWLTTQVFENLAWNAYLPLPFLIASVALGWAVANGSTRWWPVLVFAASVAAESHLFFVVPAFLVTVVALVFGLLRSRGTGRYGWLWAGLVVGALCWLAPVVQQIGGRQGNFSSILEASQGQASLGLSFALRDMGMAAALHPIWLTHLPESFFPLAIMETAYPAVYGGVVVGLMGVIALIALITGRRALGTFALIGFAVSAGLGVSMAAFPTKNYISVGYLVDVLWPVGILMWLTALWAAASVIEAIAVRLRSNRGGLPAVPDALGPLVAGLGVAVLVVVGIVGLRPVANDPVKVGWSPAENALVAQAAAAVERSGPPGGVGIVVVSPDFFLGTWSTEAIAYRLQSQGWRPGTSGVPATYNGLTVPPGSHWPTFLIRLQGTRVASVVRSS